MMQPEQLDELFAAQREAVRLLKELQATMERFDDLKNEFDAAVKKINQLSK